MSRSPRRAAPALLAGGTCLLLSGCGSHDLARTFGFARTPPDEFTVTTQAPLSMPPDFSLRPPRPGAPRPQAQSTTREAEEALVPQTALQSAQTAPMSPGQQALLAAAGPAAPGNTAAQVDREAQLEQPSRSFIDRLMFWRSPAQPGDVVNAKQESERLRRDAALGQSPTTGATPIIRSQPKGLLQRLF